MKKQYLLMAAFASTLAFTACTNDDDLGNIPGQGVTTDDGTVIEIAVSNTGSGTTKAVRPMGSSAANNNVNKVQLKFYVQDGATWKEVSLTDTQSAANGEGTVASPSPLYLTIVYEGNNTATIAATTGVLSYGNENVIEGEGEPTADRETKKAKVKVQGLMASTQYKIVAYGYNGDAFPYGALTDNQGVFSLENATNKAGHELEEVFADSYLAHTTDVIDDQDGTQKVKFNVAPKLVLTRQVAGILAYFAHVPAEIDGQVVKTIEIVANNQSKNFRFPAKDLVSPLNPVFNGVADDMTGAEDVLLSFDMSAIALNYNETTAPSEGYYTFETVSDNDAASTSGTNTSAVGKEPYATNYTGAPGLDLKENTIFGARYILPYDNHYTSQTLTIRFKGTNDAVLLTRDVTTNQAPTDGDVYQYDIRCNNFYSIGQKMATDGTDGPDDDDDDDDDDPIDLRSDNIVLVINDAWDVLHNMGVEE